MKSPVELDHKRSVCVDEAGEFVVKVIHDLAYLLAYPHDDKPGRIYLGYVGVEVRPLNVDGSDDPPLGSRNLC